MHGVEDWVVAIPISYVLGFVFNFGTAGIWVGLLLGLATLGITLLFRFNTKSKNIFG